MNLFIDTPERAAERMERRWQAAGGAPVQAAAAPSPYQQQTDDFDLDEVPGFEAPARRSERSEPAEEAPHGRRRRGRDLGRRGGEARATDARRARDSVPGSTCATADPRAVDTRPTADPRATGPAQGRFVENQDPAPYSVAGEAYREEKAYQRRRAEHGKLVSALRVIATVVLLPLLLVAVFLVSYAITCIVNGASISELSELMTELVTSIRSFFQG